MSGSSERIKREIAGVEEASAKLATEFHHTYSSYLTALGEVTKKQLILACYYVCTQAYPDTFIKLSFNQRQKMQQELRQLARKTADKLQLLLNPEPTETEAPAEIEEKEEWEEKTLENQADEERENREESSNFNNQDDNLPQPQSPEYIIHWQERIEKEIIRNLRHLSRDSNRCLQKSGILPKQLPAPILEAASNTDTSGDAIAGPPNLLNLVIETLDTEDSEGDLENLAANLARLGGGPSPNALHITAINLRLSEIEFADTGLTAWRQQIRNLSVRLNTLRREYHKKQREHSIVEAESAWRSSWFED